MIPLTTVISNTLAVVRFFINLDKIKVTTPPSNIPEGQPKTKENPAVANPISSASQFQRMEEAMEIVHI
jgi:hypothetical protein